MAHINSQGTVVQAQGLVESIKAQLEGKLSLPRVFQDITLKATVLRKSKQTRTGNHKQRSSSAAAAAATSSSGPVTAKETGPHSKDVYIGATDPKSLANLCKYASSELWIKGAIDRLVQDAVSSHTIEIAATVRLANDIEGTGEEEKVLEVPTVLNAPIVTTQRNELLSNIARSILTTGYAVVAFKKKFAKHSLGDVIFTATRTGSDKNKKRKRDEIYISRDTDTPSILPCVVVSPSEGQLEGYKCVVTGRDEFRFVPTGLSARALEDNGYRFSVYIPKAALANTAPQLPSFEKANVTIQTPIPSLYAAYVDMGIQKGFYNQSLAWNAFPVDICEVTLPKQVFDNLTDAQQLRATNLANARNSRCVSVDAIRENAPYSMSGYQTGADGMVHPATMMALTKYFRARSGGSAENNRRRPRVLSNSQVSGPGSSSSLDGRGIYRVQAPFEPTPFELVGPESNKLEYISYDWVRAKQAQTYNVGASAADSFEGNIAMLPPDITLKQHIAPKYTGIDPQTNEQYYVQKVLSTYRMTPLMMGLSGGKATVGGASSAAQSRSTSVHDAAVSYEHALYSEKLVHVQDELKVAMHWLYAECFSEMDGLALADVFEQEAKFAGAQHDSIIAAITAYEHSFLADRLIVPEDELPDAEEREPGDGPSKKQKTSDKSDGGTTTANEEEDKGLYKFTRSDLTKMIKERLLMSYNQYARTVQWLWFLTICIHGDVQLDVNFVKKKDVGERIQKPAS